MSSRISMKRAACVADFRELARRRLPNMFFEYIDGGSYDETTLRRNVNDLAAVTLRQRVLRDMTQLDMSVETLGQTLGMPVMLAPVGMAGMFGRRGELQGARAARAAGLPFCLSTVGICSVEEVAAAVTPPWFQLYVLKDRGYMRALLRRAKAAGCKVLVLTVDLPVPGARYRDVRSGFRGLSGLARFMNEAFDGITHPRWLWDVWVNGRPHVLGSVAGALEGRQSVADFLGWIAGNFDRSMTFKDLDWIREEWDGPLVIKGVLDPEDARSAAAVGAQGIVVSNHGGRQLDGVKSAIAALPPIADAVRGELEIYMDGGVRSGLDVLRAVACGAKAVLIGRAWVYALGAGGEPAITRMLQTLRAELEVAMILTGCRTLRSAGPELIDAR